MNYFVPLLAGFVFSWASAFTGLYSRLLGERGGRTLTSLLRNAIGIPLWIYGFVLAWMKPSPLYFIPVRWLMITGATLVIIGCVPIIWGHLSLGLRSHMPSIRDTLVRSGLYSFIRHPIYSGLIVCLAGLALLNPAVAFVWACALALIWALVQARFEEMDLISRMPGYRQYMDEVPGFIPFLRKRLLKR